MDFDALFERQYQRIYRIARLYFGSSSDAEDVVQTVLMKYIEKQVEFEDRNHEDAWFITVTRNYCKDIFKSSWWKRVDLGEYPERKSEQQQENDLMEYIMKLSDKYREVLYLYYYEECSIREISTMLNRKESTIQTQLVTARKKLKIEIEKGEMSYGK